MNAPNHSGWKPEMTPAPRASQETATGNRALMLEGALLKLRRAHPMTSEEVPA